MEYFGGISYWIRPLRIVLIRCLISTTRRKIWGNIFGNIFGHIFEKIFWKIYGTPLNHHPAQVTLAASNAPSPPHLKAKGPHRSSLIDPSSLPLLSFGLFTAAIENLWNFALSAVCQLGLISREGSRLGEGEWCTRSNNERRPEAVLRLRDG